MKFYPNDLFSYGANTKLVNIKLVNLLYQGRKTADFTADFAQWYLFGKCGHTYIFGLSQ